MDMCKYIYLSLSFYPSLFLDIFVGFLHIYSWLFGNNDNRQTASQLETESKIPLESAPVVAFRDAVLQGRWMEVESLLSKLQIALFEEQKLRVGSSSFFLLPSSFFF
jgi:hypothetical protein